MMKQHTYHLVVPNDASSIRLIDPFLRSHGLVDAVPTRYHDLLVCLSEAVNNAIIHGNAGDPTKSVEIDVQVGGGEFIVVVTDHGAGFDPDSLPDPRLPENLMREGGRGVFLIRQLADVVEVNVLPTGTAVLIKFFV